MPTYEYRCNSCGHEFEEFQSITASSLRKCPECKKLKLERLIGIGSAVMFKGSGFYETDYRSDSYKDAAKKDAEASKPSSETTKKSDSKSDSKPAKTETKKSDTKKPGKPGSKKGT